MVQQKTDLIQKVREQFIAPTDREIEHARKVDTLETINKAVIIKIIRCPEKKLRTFQDRNPEEISNEIAGLLDEFGDSEIVTVFQFKKDLDKRDYKNVMEKSQILSNLENITFQESNNRITADELGKEIEEFKKITDKRKIYFFIEIESLDIEDKIIKALDLGIKHFIIRAGKYTEDILWKDIIHKIHIKDGEVFISLPKRYDKQKI